MLYSAEPMHVICSIWRAASANFPETDFWERSEISVLETKKNKKYRSWNRTAHAPSIHLGKSHRQVFLDRFSEKTNRNVFPSSVSVILLSEISLCLLFVLRSVHRLAEVMNFGYQP
jgi:hypothetical protein